MKKLYLVLLALILGAVLSAPSYALQFSASSNKTLLQGPLVSVANASSFVTGASSGWLLSVGSTPITGLQLSGGSAGGGITIYDEPTTAIGNIDIVFESTIAANTNTYIDLSNAPIQTISGVVAQTSSTAGVVVYSSKNGAINN